MGEEEDIAREEGLPEACPLEDLKTHLALEKRQGRFLPMDFGVILTEEESSAIFRVYHRLREMGYGIAPENEPDRNGSTP